MDTRTGEIRFLAADELPREHEVELTPKEHRELRRRPAKDRRKLLMIMRGRDIRIGKRFLRRRLESAEMHEVCERYHEV